MRDVISNSIRRSSYWVIRRPILALIIALILLLILYYFLYEIMPNYGVYQVSDTIRNFGDGIFGGIVASLSTYALVRYFVLENETYGAKRWFNFGPSKVWIVPSYLEFNERNINPDKPYFVSPPFDAQAAGILSNVIANIGFRYPDRKIRGSHRVDEDMLKDNLVLLCLPGKNQISRIFSGLLYQIHCEKKELTEVIKLENYQLFQNDTNFTQNYLALRPQSHDDDYVEWQIRDFNHVPGDHGWYQSTINSDRTIVHNERDSPVDYALIVKDKNPFNQASTVLMLCGIHGIGTLGSAVFILQHSNKIFERYGEEPQVIILKVKYSIPRGCDNYVDCVLESQEVLFHKKLSEINEW